MRVRDPIYDTGHQLVRKRRGHPSECEDCGLTGPGDYQWASISGDFMNPEDYRRLCRRCHRVYDARKRVGDMVGKVVLVPVQYAPGNALHVECVVTAAAEVFGRVNLTVRPVSGTGEARVSADRVVVREAGR